MLKKNKISEIPEIKKRGIFTEKTPAIWFLKKRGHPARVLKPVRAYVLHVNIPKKQEMHSANM